jgi:hypothetical protein
VFIAEWHKPLNGNGQHKARVPDMIMDMKLQRMPLETLIYVEDFKHLPVCLVQ